MREESIWIATITKVSLDDRRDSIYALVHIHHFFVDLALQTSVAIQLLLGTCDQLFGHFVFIIVLKKRLS